LGRNDYRIEGNRAGLRLMEKGDQEKLVWLHRDAEEYLDAYIAAAGIDDQKAPLFQSLAKAQRLPGWPQPARHARCGQAAMSGGGVERGILRSYVPWHGHHRVLR